MVYGWLKGNNIFRDYPIYDTMWTVKNSIYWMH